MLHNLFQSLLYSSRYHSILTGQSRKIRDINSDFDAKIHPYVLSFNNKHV